MRCTWRLLDVFWGITNYLSRVRDCKHQLLPWEEEAEGGRGGGGGVGWDNRQSYNSWFKTPGLRDSQTLGLQDSRTPGLPNSKTPELQDSQTPRLPDSHTESQCERLCIWGAPHIFQMKYFAIWVAKFRFWKLDRGQRLCWCAPGLWGWSVEEVHKFILVGQVLID